MGGAGGQGGAGGGGPTCPTTSTPMLLLEGLQGPYCIDKTEVTSLQYSLWLPTAVLPDVLDAECGWKTSYSPRSSGNQCNGTHYDPAGKPDYPVACVDWCDARAFCAGVGKRLCGAFGGQPLGFNDYNKPQVSEWTFACTAGGQKMFPYGDAFQQKACVDDYYDDMLNAGNGEAVVTGSIASCEGGLPGLFDMSGNVWEWENTCEVDGDIDPTNDRCRDRGGSFWDLDSFMSCTSDTPGGHRRSSYNKNIGFRCCADVVMP
jgi:formylglycine-generating enzyme